MVRLSQHRLWYLAPAPDLAERLETLVAPALRRLICSHVQVVPMGYNQGHQITEAAVAFVDFGWGELTGQQPGGPHLPVTLPHSAFVVSKWR